MEGVVDTILAIVETTDFNMYLYTFSLLGATHIRVVNNRVVGYTFKLRLLRIIRAVAISTYMVISTRWVNASK